MLGYSASGGGRVRTSRIEVYPDGFSRTHRKVRGGQRTEGETPYGRILDLHAAVPALRPQAGVPSSGTATRSSAALRPYHRNPPPFVAYFQYRSCCGGEFVEGQVGDSSRSFDLGVEGMPCVCGLPQFRLQRPPISNRRRPRCSARLPGQSSGRGGRFASAAS